MGGAGDCAASSSASRRSAALILFDRRGTGLSDRVCEEYTLEQESRTRSRCSTRPAANAPRCSPTRSAGPSARCSRPSTRARRRADHVRVDRPHVLGARLRLGDDARGARRADRARTSPRGATPTTPRSRCSRPRWPTTRRWRRGSRACSAWRRAPARRALLLSARWPTSTCATLLPQHPRADARHAPPRGRRWDLRHSRYLAEHIPGARYVELDGPTRFPFVGDSDAILEEIEEFLTGGRSGGELAACAADGDVHRHRRRDRARRRARRRPLARPARAARRGGAQGARPLRRARGQDRRRRLPGDVRRPALARAALRAGDHATPRASSASRSASESTPASAS